MKTKKHIGLLIMLMACSTIIFAQGTSMSAGKSQDFGKEYSGQQAAEKIAGAEFIKEGLNSKYPSFVRFEESRAIPFETFFAWARKNFAGEIAPNFTLIKKENDELGYSHFRYEETFKNIPVAQSMYNVHVLNGKVISFNGEVFDLPSAASPNPVINKDAALESAKRHIGAEKYMWQDPYWENEIKEKTHNSNATYFPVVELCWFPLGFNTPGMQINYKLAYRLDLYASSPQSTNRIYVDANTGEVLKTFPLESNCSAANVNTIFNANRAFHTEKYTGTNWRLRDDCHAPKFWIRNWNSLTTTPSPVEIDNATNTWNNTMNERFGATVLWEVEQAYFYWLNARGRASYDNANGDVTGYINAIFGCDPAPTCSTSNNASMSFTGGSLKVGLGSSGTLANSYGAIDVIGHEFTHAVTGSSSNLTYANESGALNESFSDIFGEMTENFVLGNNDWLLGEERTSGAIRNMINPPANGQPDTYLGTNWYTGTADGGGVHTNSGVQNLWFYLLSQGGSGTNDNNNAYNISGIGRGSASAIAARMLVTYLFPAATYSDARNAAIASATDLFGACSNELRQTMNAWYAVGVGSQFFYATATATSNFKGSNVSCFASCNGTASAAAFNGIGGYQYHWAHGPNTANVTGLCGGTTYTVTVTDNAGAGCTATAKVTITEPPALTAAAVATSNHNFFNVSCNGGNDGTATCNPGGGTPGYTFSWTNGQLTQNASGLSAGIYVCTVTDANACTKTSSVTITQPPVLSVTAAPISNYNGYSVSCYGSSNGSALATPAGGAGAYTFAWSNGMAGIGVAGLAAGTYTVTVTDGNGCTATGTTTLTQPAQLTVDAGPNQIVYPADPDSACAILTATGAAGGVGPYTYVWSTGSPTVSISVCPAVSTVYYVTLTDANGCTKADSVRVCAPDISCGGHGEKISICKRKNNGQFEDACKSLKDVRKEFTEHPGGYLGTCGMSKVCTYLSPRLAQGPWQESIYDDVAGEISLKAFPNPFSGITSVRFSLPDNDRVSLKVVNISGQIISSIFEGSVEAEMLYDFTFDAGKYPNGIYFLDLKSENGESKVVKLVLTK